MNVNRRNLAQQLCKAVSDGDPRQVEVLLTRGADPNLVSPKGVAAVHLAAGKETEKRICCLSLLLQHQADPNIRVEDADQSERVLWGGGDLANETAASVGRASAPQCHAHLSGGGGEAAAADRHPRGAVK
ncbi:ankyrin repeat and LEM domain-containing protein 1-like [Polyodon spathula]|uniref:ankyrin repeat and LEM domain-containing protein 1-like n=1 Tax=Polyodon spathula TaxID=7913 RepID=UPI001B7DD259|nr:ankyrin repeat and LEM domain-containing protein 1-like [Polyodon spathula]